MRGNLILTRMDERYRWFSRNVNDVAAFLKPLNGKSILGVLEVKRIALEPKKLKRGKTAAGGKRFSLKMVKLRLCLFVGAKELRRG